MHPAHSNNWWMQLCRGISMILYLFTLMIYLFIALLLMSMKCTCAKCLLGCVRTSCKRSWKSASLGNLTWSPLAMLLGQASCMLIWTRLLLFATGQPLSISSLLSRFWVLLTTIICLYPTLQSSLHLLATFCLVNACLCGVVNSRMHSRHLTWS